jgi:hypothetical protein
MDLTLSLITFMAKTKKEKTPVRATVRLTTPTGRTVNFMQSTAQSSTG